MSPVSESNPRRIYTRLTKKPKNSFPTADEILQWETRTRHINVISNIFQFICFLLSIVLLLILFLTPSTFLIQSLVHPQVQLESEQNNNPLSQWYTAVKGVKPQVVVTLLVGILTVSTHSLVSRFVEHDLWLSISPYGSKANQNAYELSRRANWLRSHIDRISYAFDGSSLSLKISGISLIPLVVISSVLIAGIGQSDYKTLKHSGTVNSSSLYTGFADRSFLYNGNAIAETAAIAALQGLAIPSARTGCGRNGLCRATAKVGAVKASCAHRTSQVGVSTNQKLLKRQTGTLSTGNETAFGEALATLKNLTTLGTALNPKLHEPKLYNIISDPTIPGDSALFLNVSVSDSNFPIKFLRDRNKYADFRSSSLYTFDPAAAQRIIVRPTVTKRAKKRDISESIDQLTTNGTRFCHILGAYKELNTSNVNIIECDVRFGIAVIEQQGDEAAHILPDSFNATNRYLDDFLELSSSTFSRFRDAAAFTFSAEIKVPETGIDPDYGDYIGTFANSDTIGALLLWEIKKINGNSTIRSSSPQSVAERIENAFDYYTLTAWKNEPGAAESITLETTTVERRYTYNPYFLCILLSPIMAVTSAAFGRLKVGGSYVVPGYDPIIIAARGLSDQIYADGLKMPKSNSSDQSINGEKSDAGDANEESILRYIFSVRVPEHEGKKTVIGAGITMDGQPEVSKATLLLK